MTQLERIRIEGLHGNRDIDIPIRDNRLILVGENGVGKSTVSNFAFFFLAREWRRMESYKFDAVSLTIDSQEIRLDRKELLAAGYSKASRRNVASFPASLRRTLSHALSEFTPADILENPNLIQMISEEYQVPTNILFEFALNFRDEEFETEELLKYRARFDEIDTLISSIVDEQILYLPTYRRIERELQYIYPQLDLDEMRMRSRRIKRPRKTKETFIELVEFGMEDVESTIRETLGSLRETLRRDLNNLTGNYLREVIRGTYQSVNSDALRDLSENVINAVLDRVGENLLSNQEKRRLREIIDKINAGDPIEESDKVIIHFLIRLIELHEGQQENERSVREFVKVCNKYLLGKNLVYDNRHYNISIELDLPPNFKQDEIKLGQLSSGEKQIVSLFAHIYLSGQSSYFVIIDEPELSLSVPWQKQFLPDIWATKKCNGIIAVTHSPFIFENEFDGYAHSLDEFWVLSQ